MKPVETLQKAIAVVLIVLWLPLIISSGAVAQEQKLAAGGLNTTKALIELLRAKGVITEQEAKGFLEQFKGQALGSGQLITLTPEQNQETYLKQISEKNTRTITRDLNNLKESYEFRSQDLIKKNINLARKVDHLEEVMKEEHLPALQKSSWAQRIRFGGDIRLRHESILYDENNATNINDPGDPGAGNYINTVNDEHRERLRLRFGIKAKIIDQTEKNVGKVEAGLRVATGSVGNPVSTNYTLGDDDKSHSDIILDRAYVKWTYQPTAEVWGAMPKVVLTGGIMENPWMGSSLVWDSDLAFEGVAASFRTDTLKSNPFAGFLTLGYFPIQDAEWSQDDKYMMGGQIGFEHRPSYGWEYSVAAAIYDYENVEAFPVTETNLGPDDERLIEQMSLKSAQMGNTTFLIDQGTYTYDNLGLASDFKVFSLSGQLTNSMYFPIQVQLYWEWVKNLAYDSQSMADKTGATVSEIEEESGDIGYQMGIKVGYLKPRERWEWNVGVEYRYLESDAVLDAFTDSDFHLGGTNAKGWIFGAELGLYHNVWLKARWMTSNEITNMQQSDSQVGDLAVDTIQLDLNAAF